MFLFYHKDQTEANYKYYKGILFEKLLAYYLTANGYKVDIRRKHNSLEYDLEGEDVTTSINVVGEAKAHDKPIDGQTVAAFVGKLIPLGLMEKKVHGLFLSTSSITAEADDYFRSIKNLGVNCYTGKALFDLILKALKLDYLDQFFKKISDFSYTPLLNYILTTNYGYYLVTICGNNGVVTPSCFIVTDDKMNIINDKEFLDELASNVKELATLTPITEMNSCINDNTREIREINPGLILGRDWTDYRLPAAPQYYIGRDDLIKKIISYIEDNSTDSSKPHVFQIKSRSGVGKSSTLANISDKLIQLGYNVELHDVRDVKSILDIFSLIRRFTKVNSIPQDFSDVEKCLKSLKNNNSINVFMVDQFESTFLQPEIFNAYETIAGIVSQLKIPVYVGVARKNDQITTYDNALISLERLNSLSVNFELKDFTNLEAKELIDKINVHSTKTINKEVLAYVLEFAQGFPWLLKRTMAHIIKLTNGSNIPQKQLISTGLMLDDLFNEELEGLEEVEKEYIVRISSRLPADYHQLQRIFEDDPLLPKLLDKFTQMRLLRLSGSTYDTYNDVFKEYLVYQKLPEFKHQFLCRLYPNPTITFFDKVIRKSKFTLEQLSKTLKTSQKTLGNYLKECRQLNIIRKEEEYWVVPKNIQDIYTQGMLGGYIRRQLLANDLVSGVMLEVQKRQVNMSDLGEYIKSKFPYIDASDGTWGTYANILYSWLTVTKIVTMNKNDSMEICTSYTNDDSQLGNLQQALYGRKILTNELIPSVSWSYMEKCFMKIKNGEQSFDGEVNKALLDLKRSGIYSEIQKYTSLDSFKEDIINKYLSTEKYCVLWDSARNDGDIKGAVRSLLNAESTESTLQWRIKKILNWGKALGIIEKKRYKYN